MVGDKIKLNRLIVIVLIAFFTVFPVLAGEKENHYFTNQDLEKYRKPSDTKSPVEARSVDKTTDFKESTRDEKPEEKKPKRHVISYETSEGTEMRIIIPVKFNGRITANMLLDTGATGMYVSYKLAEKIGVFDSEEAQLLWVTGGIGGTIPAIITIVDTIEIGDMEYHFIPTTISSSISPDFEGLIGMDFMTNYSIHIETDKHEVMFEERPESSKLPAGRTETWWRVTFRRFKSMRSVWERYREKLNEERQYSIRLRDLRIIADRQYEKAEELYDRLNVYASMHSVPLEWR